MSEMELLTILRDNGWAISIDDAGDSYGIISLKSTLIRILPTVKKRPNHYRISLMPSVSTVDFSNVVDEILDERGEYCSIVVSNIVPEKVIKPSVEDISLLSDKAINWAKTQDIESMLRKYIELPTSSKGINPAKHLAALALSGDVDKLLFYKESFNANNRLDFVPYITVDMIERAFIIASRNNR